MSASTDSPTTENYEKHITPEESSIHSKDKVIRKIIHMEQQNDWDCGIAAVGMCLDVVQRQLLYSQLDFFSTNENRGFGNSVWTIDLCYLLANFKISHKMFTKHIGVNPNLKSESYYSQTIDKDEMRVERLFRESAQNGISVTKGILLLEEILDYLKSTGPIIFLVDVNYLFCRDCFHDVKTNSYEGHFIVAVGYDLKDEMIYYRDPNRSKCICRIGFDQFEIARGSLGTDNDAIVIEEQFSIRAHTRILRFLHCFK